MTWSARVDAILTGLRIGSLATALAARLEPPCGAESCTLQWSSAGHLPRLLVLRGGSVQVLDTPAERLLGAELFRPRTDHGVVLRAGDTVVLYTGGLVEEGRTGIDEGIARLAGVLPEVADLSLEKLCDQLLDHIVAGRADDDIALLALRCHAGDAEPEG